MRHFRRKHREAPRDDSAMEDGLSAQAVASLPPPGLSGPSQPVWSPDSSRYLVFANSDVQAIRQMSSPPSSYQTLTALLAAPATVSESNGVPATSCSRPPIATIITTATTVERTLLVLDMKSPALEPRPLLRLGSFPSTIGNTTGDTTSESAAKCAEPPHLEDSLEERLRRERQRLSSGSSLTQFEWAWLRGGQEGNTEEMLRLLIPVKGSLYIQDGVLGPSTLSARCLHDKSLFGSKPAFDAQLSPDAAMVAWASDGELYCKASAAVASDPAIRLTYGAVKSESVCISHGVADFVAQEEMDRYTGSWWNPNSQGILFARVDESSVPIFRIVHYPSQPILSSDASIHFEDHRYPFAGKKNPSVRLGYILIDRDTILPLYRSDGESRGPTETCTKSTDSEPSAADMASRNWTSVTWFDAPSEASEYLARVYWLPDGNSVIAQWQNRAQDVSVLYRMDILTGQGHTLLTERSKFWINLHDMFLILPHPIHPDACSDIEDSIPSMPTIFPTGSFSFLFASERTGFMHIYLYTYVPGINDEQAILIRAVSAGEWMVEHIAGVDVKNDTVYLTGTFDSVLERHLYVLPLTNRSGIGVNRSEGHGMSLVNEDHLVSSGTNANGMRKSINKVINAFSGKSRNVWQIEGKAKTIQRNPSRLTFWSGMHTIVMDSECRYFVDIHSDLDRPTTVSIYKLQSHSMSLDSRGSPADAVKLVKVLFAAENEDKSLTLLLNREVAIPQPMKALLPAPELFSLPTLDGAETLHAALYRPDPQVHGAGPYPLVCAVYGGPHVQRVNRSWAQCADMRAQRLRKLGFCVVKCDNRGSSRRGVAFESAIYKNLGRVEVLDQIAVVRHLVVRGIADGARVGVYGWSYGGYLATMCLCRAPDVFHVAVAGAPVTSWDGYDTHYTERYLGLPSENASGYQESALFDHVPNLRGKLMIVHGLIDENVHFRHSSRLINKLTNAGKDYELLVFPDERHSPRRLRDRIYMEQRISDYFVQNLSRSIASQVDIVDLLSQSGVKRQMAGNL